MRVEGIKFTEGETKEELRVLVKEELTKGGVVLKDRDIVRLHRSSKPFTKDGVTTKQCLVKLSNWSAREKFVGYNKRARNSGGKTRAKNDLTKRRLGLLEEARKRIYSRLKRSFNDEEINELPDAENVFAYANINSDLRIRARGTVHQFASEAELEDLIAHIFPETTR